jgi:hypothetical protein
MCAVPSEGVSDADHIDTICLILFDDWCAMRSIIPLIYLMQCWPLLDKKHGRISLLSTTLAELLKYHADALTPEQTRLLGELIYRAGNLLMHTAP